MQATTQTEQHSQAKRKDNIRHIDKQASTLNAKPQKQTYPGLRAAHQPGHEQRGPKRWSHLGLGFKVRNPTLNPKP